MKNMKNMKKMVSLVLVLIISINLIPVNRVIASFVSVDKSISSLNDREFDEFLVNYLVANSEAGKSENKIRSELREIGVVLGDINSVDYSFSKGMIAPNKISPTKATLNTTVAKVSGQTNYRIYSYVNFREKETTPGSLDVLSIEWNPSIASYVKNDHDSYYTSYMDGTKREKGVLLFNVDDSLLKSSGDIAYASVYVKPKKSGNLKTYSQFVHTYEEKAIKWSVGGNIGYVAGGPTGGASFTLTGSNIPDNWKIASDTNTKITK